MRGYLRRSRLVFSLVAPSQILRNRRAVSGNLRAADFSIRIYDVIVKGSLDGTSEAPCDVVIRV